MSGGEGWNYINRFNPPLFSACVSPWPRYPLTSVVVIFVFKSLRLVLLYCWHLLRIYPYFPPCCIINWNKRINNSIYFGKTLSRCILNCIINRQFGVSYYFTLFSTDLVAFKYCVQSDWMIIVYNLELPCNVRLKIQVVTDRVSSGFEVRFVLLNLQFSV
jgi:hypothetical protein